MTLQISQIGWIDGLPHSVEFDDKYYCEENGLKESEHVFCDGNKLKDRFKALDNSEEAIFTIAETGFGTGLNFLSAWKQFVEHAPVNAQLHFISIDQFPLSKDDLARALSFWGELSHYSRSLIDQYPSPEEPIYELNFDSGRIKLTLIFEHVLKALDRVDQSIDAWFLDGFAPPEKSPDVVQ